MGEHCARAEDGDTALGGPSLVLHLVLATGQDVLDVATVGELFEGVRDAGHACYPCDIDRCHGGRIQMRSQGERPPRGVVDSTGAARNVRSMDYRQRAREARNKRRRYITIPAKSESDLFHAIGSRIVGGDVASVCGLRTSPAGIGEEVTGSYRPHLFCLLCDDRLELALNDE